MIEKIVNLIIDNFDFSFMFVINVLTYLLIKTVDAINGKKKVPILQKRLILVFNITILSIIYIIIGYNDYKVLLNSAILAPVFWSWIAAPICNKIGINYRKVDEVINDKSE